MFVESLILPTDVGEQSQVVFPFCSLIEFVFGLDSAMFDVDLLHPHPLVFLFVPVQRLTTFKFYFCSKSYWSSYIRSKVGASVSLKVSKFSDIF